MHSRAMHSEARCAPRRVLALNHRSPELCRAFFVPDRQRTSLAESVRKCIKHSRGRA